MCGIHFVINTEGFSSSNALDDFLSDCFIANQVRGVDSSGLFQVKNYKNAKGNQDVVFHKSSLNGSDFVSDRVARPLIVAAKSSRVTVGHVRAATQGAVTASNAHPFSVTREDGSKLIGVHNGTLRNWRNKKGADEHAVDSEWLLTKIAEDGIDAFEGIEGAWAVVWFDSNSPDTLFIARNKERPLFYGITEDGKSMVAASELGMLGWLADRNKIKLAKNEKNIKFFYPPEDHVMEISLSTLDVKCYKYPEFNAAKYAKPTPPVVHAPYNHSANVVMGTSWQDSVLSRIKDALRLGLQRAVAREEDEPPFSTTSDSVDANDDAGFEAAVRAEVERFSSLREDDGDTPATHFTTNVSYEDKDLGYIEKPVARRAASAEERRRAKDKGMFGLVVEFCGYWFDDADKSVYGDFSMKIGESMDSYDSIIRGQTKAVAESKFVDPSPSKTHKLVVVGMTTPSKFNGDRPYYILADIVDSDVVRKFDMSPKRAVH